MRRFEYEGPIYIRPIGRGVILEQSGATLDDEIETFVSADPASGWQGELRIIVEEIENRADTIR